MVQRWRGGEKEKEVAEWMDGSIAQAAANDYNNRKRTRREGVRSAITVPGEPPAAPPERQGVRRMHK